MTATRERGVQQMGTDMMKASTKLSVTAAAGLLGVALAAGGAYAATGSLAAADAPGQVLPVSGVGPAAGHASATALTHANARARGLFGTTPANAKTTAKGASGVKAMPAAAGHNAVGRVARPAPQTLPAYHAAMPTPAAAHPAVPAPMMTPGMNVPPHPMR